MFKNQRGVGLIAVLIASGLVVLLALAVGRFITQFNQQSIRTENSAACQSIAKDVIEYFKKDDNALFITSVGPDPVTKKFPTGIVNEDGVERFNFGGGNIFNISPIPSPPANPNLITFAPYPIPPAPQPAPEQPLPKQPAPLTTVTFYNYLNYRNSFNRLLALAYSQGKCCTDANSCNSPLYDSSNPTSNPPGLKLVNNGNPFQVFLGVNPIENGTSLCSGTTPSRLVDPRASSIQMEFYVRVVNNPTDSQKKSQCTASGQVQFPRDTNAPLTILSLDTSSLCSTPAGKVKTPSMCLASGASQTDAIRYKIRTVRNEARCSNCLIGNTTFNGSTDILAPYACANNNGDAFRCFNTNQCVGSDPGSIFLCRIGERGWFYNRLNWNKWEPCEAAHVYRGDGTPMTNAKVVIKYNTPGAATSYTGSYTADATTRQTYTEAVLELSDLDPQAAYVVDVRAVDGGGQLAGASFCTYSRNCNLNVDIPPTSPLLLKPAHFVISNGPPRISTPVPQTGVVGSASSHPYGSITLPERYGGALSTFDSSAPIKHFQCTTSAKESFSVNYDYNNAPNGTLGIETMTASITSPAYAGSVSIDDHDPFNSFGTFTAGPNAGNPDGNYAVEAVINNECFPSANVTSPPYNWCLDTNASFSVGTRVGDTGDYDSTLKGPSPKTIIGRTNVTGKACGMAFACPTLSGSPTPPNFRFSYGASADACDPSNASFNMQWNPLENSGCFAKSPSFGQKQYCIRAIDPCGRGIDGPTGKTYSSTLAESSPTSTTYYCGSGFSGNFCDSGLFCSQDRKCLSSNRKTGKYCNNNSECIDPPVDCTLPSPDGSHGTCLTDYRCKPNSSSYLAASFTGTCNQPGDPCGAYLGTCNAGKCSFDTSRDCTDNNDCGDAQNPGTCQYYGGQKTCLAPTNQTCGNPTNVACPDLNSCEAVSAPPDPVCDWVETGRTACTAVDPCNCTYKPDFITSGTQTVTYECRVISGPGVGGACGTCASPNPSGNIPCAKTCSTTVSGCSSQPNPWPHSCLPFLGYPCCSTCWGITYDAGGFRDHICGPSDGGHVECP